MILTKSISRWARNTVDTLNTVRTLQKEGVAVLFEKENINTMDLAGEMLMTIMSSFAQQESESISQNVRLGIRYQMEQGKRKFDSKRMLGYRRNEKTGKGEIVPEEADLVRSIYRWYLEGYTTSMIPKMLAEKGIDSLKGRSVWNQSAVIRMLENEKYCGSHLMQKYYVSSCLDHSIEKNRGKLAQYIVDEDHDPIVPKQVWDQVQGEMLRRSSLKLQPSKIRFGKGAALEGRLVCGICGRTLKFYRHLDPADHDWRCMTKRYTLKTDTRKMKPSCACRSVPDGEARRALLSAFNSLPEKKAEIEQKKEELTWKLRDYDERIRALGEEQAYAEERKTLLLARSHPADTEFHTRLLLEFIAVMEDWKKAGGSPVKETWKDGACRDYEEFMRRTRYIPEDGILGADGRVEHLPDEVAVRYLDRVVVEESGYAVRFKAGVEVFVPAG